jgi:hypothetical protein
MRFFRQAIQAISVRTRNTDKKINKEIIRIKTLMTSEMFCGVLR